MKKIYFAILSIFLIALFIGVAFSAVDDVAKKNISTVSGQSVIDYVKFLNFTLIGGATTISMDELFRNQNLVDINYEIDSIKSTGFFVSNEKSGALRVYLTKKDYATTTQNMLLTGNYMLKENSNLKLINSVDSFTSDYDSKLVDASELYFEYVKGSYFSVNYKGYELKNTTIFNRRTLDGKTGVDANFIFRYGSKYYSAQLIAMPCVDANNKSGLCYTVYSIGEEAPPVPKDPTNPAVPTPNGTLDKSVDYSCGFFQGSAVVSGGMKACIYKNQAITTIGFCQPFIVSSSVNCEAKKSMVQNNMGAERVDGNLVASLVLSANELVDVGTKFTIKVGNGPEVTFTSDGTNFIDSEKRALLIPTSYLGSLDYAIMYPSTNAPSYYVHVTLDIDMGSDQVYITKISQIK